MLRITSDLSDTLRYEEDYTSCMTPRLTGFLNQQGKLYKRGTWLKKFQSNEATTLFYPSRILWLCKSPTWAPTPRNRDSCESQLISTRVALLTQCTIYLVP